MGYYEVNVFSNCSYGHTRALRRRSFLKAVSQRTLAASSANSWVVRWSTAFPSGVVAAIFFLYCIRGHSSAAHGSAMLPYCKATPKVSNCKAPPEEFIRQYLVTPPDPSTLWAVCPYSNGTSGFCQAVRWYTFLKKLRQCDATFLNLF